MKLAETIADACRQYGVKVEIKEDYTTSWMRGKKTAGVLILDGDLAHFLSAVIANAQLFTDGEIPKFSMKNRLSVSPFRLSLILY